MALVNGTNYDHIDLHAASGGDVTRHKLQDTDGRAMVAPTEASSTASAAHPAGSYFIYNNKLYQATSDIASGGTITPNTNCKEAPLGASVSDLKSAFKQVTQSTRNLFDETILGSAGLSKDGNGYWYGKASAWNTAFSSLLPIDGTFGTGKRYTISCKYYFSDVGTYTGNVNTIKTSYSDSSSTNTLNFSASNTTETSASATTTASKNVDYLFMAPIDAQGNNYILHIKELQIEEGTSATTYIQHITSQDLEAEKTANANKSALIEQPTFSFSPGLIDSSGNINYGYNPTRQEVYSNKIYGVQKGTISVVYSAYTNRYVQANYYGISGFISQEVLINSSGSGELSAEFTCPPGTIYVIFVLQTGGKTYTLSGNFYFGTPNLSKLFENEMSVVDSIRKITLNPQYVDGYIDANGVLQQASTTYQEITTEPIYGIRSLEYFFYFTTSKAQNVLVSEYNNSGFVKRTQVVNATQRYSSGSLAMDSATTFVRITYRTYGLTDTTVTLTGYYNSETDQIEGKDLLSILATEPEKTAERAVIGSYIGRGKAYYDHIFSDKIYSSAVIPFESIFNVETSKRLGFECIEANVHKLSDSNYLVMHGVNGTFGEQVHHVDRTTDISNVEFSSVTLDWVKANVRFNSDYEKYRIAPSSLQEFLTACRTHCLIPLIQMVDTDEIAIADKIMGKGNYIAYTTAGKAIRKATTALIAGWNSLTDSDAIVQWIKAFYPCSYGMSNPNSFTDEALKAIVEAVHNVGGFIHFAYSGPANQIRLQKLGFDFSASYYSVNEFESGNLCNLSADVGFSDFTTEGTVYGNNLSLTNGQTIIPNATLNSVFLGKGSLHIRFNGTLTIVMGQYINTSFTSDGTEDIWLSTYFLEEVPTFSITATASTTVYSITYKASKC